VVRKTAPSQTEGLRCLTTVNTEHQIATSVVVIGTGGAGRRAHHARRRGHQRGARGLEAQRRSPSATASARGEVDELLAANGSENVRALRRALRNTMTEHAGVMREETGLYTHLPPPADLRPREDLACQLF
jgi:succinate dehydrogenase/fumarate reductase flavoprotein subunit